MVATKVGGAFTNCAPIDTYNEQRPLSIGCAAWTNNEPFISFNLEVCGALPSPN
jgi:hypothetical protein